MNYTQVVEKSLGQLSSDSASLFGLDEQINGKAFGSKQRTLALGATLCSVAMAAIFSQDLFGANPMRG